MKPLPRTLRLGFTGTRKFRASQIGRVDQALAAMMQVAQDATAPGHEKQSTIHLITSLARGADRRAAEQALARGFALFVAMPFPQADYRLDFLGREDDAEPALTAAEDAAEFDHLLAQAGTQWLALDGDRATDPERAYEAAGRFTVRHADILIAVWDGQTGQGRGGTGDIVRYAATAGVPIWWIHATEDRPPAWITDPQDLYDPPQAPGEAEARLGAYLASLFKPPEPVRLHRRDWIGHLARLGQAHHHNPLHGFLHESEPRPSPIWRLHGALMRAASGLAIVAPVMAPPQGAPARYWHDRFAPADRRATEYAARYRSSYVWVFLLGIAALIGGDLAPTFALLHAGPWGGRLAVIGEAGALALIVVFVGATIRNGWHERYIEYRLLAELCRAQQALSHVGFSIANGQVRRMASEDRIVWVAWLFAAWQRAAPLPTGQIAATLNTEAPRAIAEFVHQQCAYYDGRARVAEAAHRRFSLLGTLCFAGVLGCVALRLLATWSAVPPWPQTMLELLAALLPGFSAAFVGIGAYAELQIVAGQSRRMVLAINGATQRLARLQRVHGARALLSQELGREAAAISTFMLQELDGWAQLFRVKIIETG